MKLNFVHLPILAVAAFFMAACVGSDDNPAVLPPNPVSPEAQNVDPMEFIIDVPTYVVGDLTGMYGTAFANRLTNKVNTLDERVKLVIFDGTQVPALPDEDYKKILNVYLNGGTVLVIYPRIQSVHDIGNKTFQQPFEKDESLELEALDNGINTFLSFGEKNSGAESMSAIAIRPYGVYVIGNNGEYEETVSGETQDGKLLQPSEPKVIPFDYKESKNDVGRLTDLLVKWIEKKGNKQALTRASDAEQQVQDLMTANEYINSYTHNYSSWGNNETHTMPVELIYHYYPIYDFAKNTDYYVFDIEQRMHAEQVDCWGTKNKDDFKFYNDAVWCNIDGKHDWNVVGPYYHGVKTENSFSGINGEKVFITDYEPQSSVGSSSVSTSHSYSLSFSGNAGFNMSGPTGGVTAGISLGYSTSHSSSMSNVTVGADINSNHANCEYTCQKVNIDLSILDYRHDVLDQFRYSTVSSFETFLVRIENVSDLTKSYTLNITTKTKLGGSGYYWHLAIGYIHWPTHTLTVNRSFTMAKPSRYCRDYRVTCDDEDLRNYLEGMGSVWDPEFTIFTYSEDNLQKEAEKYFDSMIKQVQGDANNGMLKGISGTIVLVEKDSTNPIKTVVIDGGE